MRIPLRPQAHVGSHPLERIEPWSIDTEGRVIAHRRAEFWTARADRRVSCELCYRRCDLADGETGWCSIRRNERGRLQIPEHGVIGGVYPVYIQYFWYRKHARVLNLGGVGCTAHCSFCTSTIQTWAPEKVPWVQAERGGHRTDPWAHRRAMLHPVDAIVAARNYYCSGINLSQNEPLLTFEWSMDAAALAKKFGLGVSMDTQGFASPVATRRIAPFIDSVHFGIKGHADPEFYARRMRSEGAVPHVLKSAKIWRQSGVALGISDLIPPAHWMNDDQVAEACKRLYSWIAEELGPNTPLWTRPMVVPKLPTQRVGEGWNLMMPNGDGLIDVLERMQMVMNIARDCGLKYVYDNRAAAIDCHQCGAEIVGKGGWHTGSVHVTDGRCDYCQTAVPIVALSRTEYDDLRALAARELAAGLPALQDLPTNGVGD